MDQLVSAPGMVGTGLTSMILRSEVEGATDLEDLALRARHAKLGRLGILLERLANRGDRFVDNHVVADVVGKEERKRRKRAVRSALVEPICQRDDRFIHVVGGGEAQVRVQGGHEESPPKRSYTARREPLPLAGRGRERSERVRGHRPGIPSAW